jgi:hypothetical protein
MTDSEKTIASCAIGLDPKEIGALIQAVKDTKEDVGEIKKILQSGFDKQNGHIAKHEDRIRILENWRWYLMGAIGLGLVVTGFIIK